MATTADRIRETLAQRRGRNSAYSLRALARDLGVSHGYLSLVLHGKRRLPVERAADFARRLGLDAALRAELVDGAARERSEKKPRASKTARASRELVELALDRFRAVSDWYHLALLDLTLLKGFIAEEAWMARRLGITRREVREATARLERLGLLERAARWRKTKDTLRVKGAAGSAPLRRFHRQMIAKALDELKVTRPNAVAAREISGTTLTVNPARLADAKKRITRFRRSLAAFLSEGECTELYQLNVQLFPLTKGRTRSRR